MGLFFVFCVITQISVVISHVRWKCPPPRDINDKDGAHITFENTGNKVYRKLLLPL